MASSVAEHDDGSATGVGGRAEPVGRSGADRCKRQGDGEVDRGIDAADLAVLRAFAGSAPPVDATASCRPATMPSGELGSSVRGSTGPGRREPLPFDLAGAAPLARRRLLADTATTGARSGHASRSGAHHCPPQQCRRREADKGSAPLRRRWRPETLWTVGRPRRGPLAVDIDDDDHDIADLGVARSTAHRC